MSAWLRSISHTGRAWLVLALGAIVAGLVPLASQAAPNPPTATSIEFATISTPSVTLPPTPGANGLTYVVAGTEFTVDLAFFNGSDPAPLSWNQTVTVTVSYGGTTLGSTDVPPGMPTASLTGLTIPSAATGITLKASADTKPKATTGTSPVFDVLITQNAITPTGRSSIGGETGTDACNATTDKPVCGDLYPPTGGFQPGGYLSQGLCDKSCKDSYVQPLVAFAPSPTNPALLVMRCDKLTCGTGAIKKIKLVVTLAPGTGDVTAPACPAKGTVGLDQKFCVDYVQSTRDNAGDTMLYLLFVEDAKVRFP